MTAITRIFLVFGLVAGLLTAQQPNSGFASMQINGSDLGVYPILVNVRTSLPATFTFGGAINQPYFVYQTSAALAVGTTTVPASNSQNSVDIPLTPVPAKVIDGLQVPAFSTNLTGTGSFTLNVPNAGSAPNGIPLGTQLSLQGALWDPFSSIGVTLTSATRVTVTQGATVTFYTLGDEGVTTVSAATVPLPFFGNNYTTLHLYANGYVCLGTNQPSDFTPSLGEFTSGPPRVAPFWSDLDCPANAVKVTLDTPQSGVPGYVRIEYTNVTSGFGAGGSYNFSTLLRDDGYLEIVHPPTSNASVYDQVTGIGPGSNLGGTQTQKNFVGAQPAGSSVGPGILTTPPNSYLGAVNESFIEWYGIVTQHFYYAQANAYDNPFDLFATTLHFLPSGTGSLPGSSNRYTLY